MPLYDFYWDDGREGFIVEIDEPLEAVEKLLDEYRNNNPTDYNSNDFIEFLKKKRVKAKYITFYRSYTPVEVEADHHIYF